jgi:hypothetical protein
LTIHRNAPSLAAALAAAVFIFPSQPPAHAVSHPPLRASQKPASPSPQTRLAALLAKAAQYCEKLESAVFDFVCREELAESVNPSLDVGPNSSPPKSGGAPFLGPTVSVAWTNKINRTFVSDLRCQRADGAIHETRTPLEENGKETAGSDALPGTPAVAYDTAFLGPVGLFGKRFQPGFEFSVAGEEDIGTTRALVVEAKPKAGAGLSRPGPIGFAGTAAGGGKAWIDPATGNILRIEWSESRVGRFDVFEKRGRLYNRTPRLVISSEFSAEKNGIRFPSRLTVEEAYLKESGKAFIRSKTEVVYKDFKFFTVEFDVRD